ncbi:MAG: NAD(P)-dependent alcohol dehydrogenase [Verrucomicrobiae bacterium]|nr:NAD(P)-dependent alcohol dehydrogenase [Verrucomicrobiae bacterium]
MRRYQLQPAAGEKEELELVLEDAPAPDPGPGEVRVRVTACSLNYRDLLMKRGQSASSAGGGVVPLSDGAGVVDSIGEGVTAWREGDRVMGAFFRDWRDGSFDMSYHQAARGGSCDGMLADFVVGPAESFVATPDYLTDAEAACLPCAGLTAWHGLFERGGLKAGQTVLALGTGGVSVFGLQLATAAGARVVITSSSDEKLAQAREFGAWETINYREHEDWDKRVWDITGKRGVDHVIEVGGPGTLGRSLNSVTAGGHIALIGVLTGFSAPDATLFPLVARNADLHGIYVGSVAMFERLNAFLAEKEIRPVIDRSFSFEEAEAAYAHLRSGEHVGKIVIEIR